MKRAPFLFIILLFSIHLEGKEPESAEELYEEGMKKLKGGVFGADPDRAIEIFKKIIELYPDSEYVIPAEIGIGDAHYRKKDYHLAVESYKSIYERIPDYERGDYVLFRIGECFYRLTPSVDRDLTPAQNGVVYLETLIKKYPDSPYVKDARKMLDELLYKLAEKELRIGDFYLKRGDIGSAEKRFRAALETSSHPSIQRKAREALKKIEGAR